VNKECFIEEVKISNILNNNEQKVIQSVRCFQFFTQFEIRHKAMNTLVHFNIQQVKSLKIMKLHRKKNQFF
jgi:hypothetical protein